MSLRVTKPFPAAHFSAILAAPHRLPKKVLKLFGSIDADAWIASTTLFLYEALDVIQMLILHI